MQLILHKEIFNDIYFPYLTDYSKRYEVYYGGAGSGKSVWVAQKLVYKALTGCRKILVLRKVGRTTKQSTFQLLLDTLNQWGLLSKCKINKTDFTITLPNGSCFLCTGLDDPEKIKSIAGITDAWLEEATEFSQDDFNQIDLRIRTQEPNQQIILSFNPVSKANWCYLLFFSDNKDYDEFRSKCMILHSSYKDNPWLPQPYIDSLLLLKNTNPAYFKIYAEGEFGSLEKLVYNNWQQLDFDHTKIEGQLAVGLDFGFTNDPTALIASIVNEQEKRIYIFGEAGGQNMLSTDIADMIRYNGFAKSTIIADSADQRTIEEIRRLGISRIRPCIKGQDSILQGIQKVQQYELIVDPDCWQVIEELQNYAWTKDKKTNEYINKPIDKYNHFLDALRYSLQCCEINPRIKTMDKSMLF